MAKDSDRYSDAKTVQRREAALKRMLSTPHQPHKPIGKKAVATVKRSRPAAKSK